MALSFDNVRSQFEQYLSPALLTIPVEYENAPMSADLVAARSTNNPWARVQIQQGPGMAIDIGKYANRRWAGIVIVSFFDKLNVGTANQRKIADIITDNIVTYNFTGILIRTPEFATIGKEDDWFHSNLTIPFEVNQLTS